MLVRSVNKKIRNHKPKAEVDEMIKKMRKEDEKMVKGQFEFTEAEGGTFDFTYRIYPGEAIQHFTFVHGENCEIPMGVVKHLNNTKKKIRKWGNYEQSRAGGVVLPKPYDMISRVRFIPSDYI